MNAKVIVGIILIVIGAVFIGYQSFSYTEKEELIDIGPLKVTTENRKTIPLSPIVGGIFILGGIGMVFYFRGKK